MRQTCIEKRSNRHKKIIYLKYNIASKRYRMTIEKLKIIIEHTSIKHQTTSKRKFNETSK